MLPIIDEKVMEKALREKWQAEFLEYDQSGAFFRDEKGIHYVKCDVLGRALGILPSDKPSLNKEGIR